MKCWYNTFYQGAECYGVYGNDRSCNYGTFNSGSVCHASYKYDCMNATINSGSKCIAESPGAYNCDGATINDGGKCVAQAKDCPFATYNGTGCCEGTYCGANTPKCDCPIRSQPYLRNG